MNFIKRGSVKDIYRSERPGHLVFVFSNRYSVFDWGEMPDTLEDKGRALAFFCSLFFKKLRDPGGWDAWFRDKEVRSTLREEFSTRGLPNHFVSCLDEKGKEVEDIFSVGRSILVEKCRVPAIFFRRGAYDYRYYGQRRVDTLVPLEIIFRHGLPSGSSLLKRLGNRDYLAELGLEDIPREGTLFEEPLIEFSTKLEKSDRYITRKEAQTLAGMSDTEMESLRETARLLALRLKHFFQEVNLQLWDGKFEFSFMDCGPEKDRAFKFVDSLGPDEIRLLSGNIHLSKEIFRSFYRSTPWAEAVEKAKAQALEEGVSDWKALCPESPPTLPPDLKAKGENLYRSLSNTLAQHFLGHPLFQKAPSLEVWGQAHRNRRGEDRGHVVILGQGGREHALAWKMAQSPRVEKVTVLPGNAGMALTPKVTVDPRVSSLEEMIRGVGRLDPDLCLIGPEQYLVEGLADKLSSLGLRVFGPSREASRLESSKIFMKEMLTALDLPTAPYKTAASLAKARELVDTWPWKKGLVVKSDTLAGGKGVFVCPTREGALKACENLLANESFPIKSENIILEEMLVGEELSSFYLCDGRRAYYLASARDYKRIFDGNCGPNTGGMGSYIPEDQPSASVRRELDSMAQSVLSHMEGRGMPFLGFLFIGSMIVEDRPYILEFNVRFGDPEAQTILPALENDLFSLLNDLMEGRGLGETIRLKRAVHVVASSRGYPSLDSTPMALGCPISFERPEIFRDEEGPLLFMAGVEKRDGPFVNTGGRVLGVTSVAGETALAREMSYRAMESIAFEGMHYRRDIAELA